MMKVSTPGRICLFGEHQDYLLLPVIACAISQRITITGSKRMDGIISIELPDIGKSDSFRANQEAAYLVERDYIRSGFNVMLRNGLTFTPGFQCIIRSGIPISAGVSSSSALMVAWIHFLARISDQSPELVPEEIARYAHAAEVLEFREPGGMMDQYTTAVGKAVWIGFYPEVDLMKLPCELGTFILGDSNEPKDTKAILSRIKNSVHSMLDNLRMQHPQVSIQDLRYDNIANVASSLNDKQIQLLQATIRNRDITQEAKYLLMQKQIDHRAIGSLLNEQHAILRDALHVSTPKIDAMLIAALNAGAYGGKLTGSGGGGCMFAYAPANAEKVRKAISQFGDASIVVPDKGTRLEPI